MLWMHNWINENRRIECNLFLKPKPELFSKPKIRSQQIPGYNRRRGKVWCGVSVSHDTQDEEEKTMPNHISSAYAKLIKLFGSGV